MNKRTTLKTWVIPLIVSIIGININCNKLLAQGPKSPEAASFEPVDATDMVNLSTGDFTYVLPLLNVPSPEGGYPLALAYHAGIAMDQEASWTGLGWNLNAGAINRSVNGYPDDYNSTPLMEYFYDKGVEETYQSISVGFTTQTGVSVGLGWSWGSNKSRGGFVSIGYGPQTGLGASLRLGEGSGLGLGYSAANLSYGLNISGSGKINGSVGVGGVDTNGVGFNISTTGSVGLSYTSTNSSANKTSLGISLSSNGVGFNAGVTNGTMNGKSYTVDGGIGSGMTMQFQNTESMGDYVTETSGWSIPLFVPLGVGTLSLTYGKQKVKYYLGKNAQNFVDGPIYFDEGTTNVTRYKYRWKHCAGNIPRAEYVETTSPIPPIYSTTGEAYFYVEQLSQENGTYYWFGRWHEPVITITYENVAPCTNAEPDGTEEIGIDEAFMDIYEVPLEGITGLSEENKLDYDNAAFPNYDKYNVQAQGLSGNISSRLYENGNLFGLKGKETENGFELSYALDGSVTTIPAHAQFNSKPHFYFDNEISSYLGVDPANFNTSNNYSTLLSYYSGNVASSAEPRNENSAYIQHFFNEDLANDLNQAKANGYLLPDSNFDVNSSRLPTHGIGAFKITAIDGKTYHYSLPVYNREIAIRTYGVNHERPDEDESYFEKRQLEPYATHWLLTAVTGPDYYDANDNGLADKGDYGYWVNFEYGKWSEAFAWKTPYGRDYLQEPGGIAKTKIHGRKEVYYLDKVVTRTHTALFVKSERMDAQSEPWDYYSVDHIDDLEQDESDFDLRFSIPAQKPLRLDKIILVYHDDALTINKASGTSNEDFVDIEFNDSGKQSEESWFNLKDNVLDTGDNWNSVISNALKVIEFNYDYSLANGSPNTASSAYGRLTLQSVDFKGKSDTSVIPPYEFSYNNDLSYSFNIEDKDSFGYYDDDNSLWSLNEITTPQGGKIAVNYESHQFKSATEHEFTKYSSSGGTTYGGTQQQPSRNDWYYGAVDFTLTPEELFVNVGDNVNVKVAGYHNNGPYEQLEGIGTITAINGNQVTVLPPQNATITAGEPFVNGCAPYGICWNKTVEVKFTSDANAVFSLGGIRVADIKVTDGTNEYKTAYKYGENEDGVGYISYLPFAPELQEELPFSNELPAPRPMYEYVSVKSLGTNNVANGKTQYKFKVFKDKDPNAIKFGDLYEINIVEHTNEYNSVADKDVEVKSFTIKDNLATLGQLLAVSNYNEEGHLLNKIENTYYNRDETPNNIGISQEAYQTYKEIDYEDNSSVKDKWLINSSVRIRYPNLLKTSTEYKSGYTYTTNFGDIDPISGLSNEILSYNSEGLEIKSKTIPAYHKYAQMGSKVTNVSNKNMLSQSTAQYSYVKDPETSTWKEINVGVTTWNKEWDYLQPNGSWVLSSSQSSEEKVWRKYKSYVWAGELNADGSYNNFMDDFNWDSGTQSSDWKELSETTLYTRFSSPIETRDINNNYAAVKTSNDDGSILVVANALITEMYYSGAENISSNTSYFDGQVKSAGQSNAYAHTGENSVLVSSINDRAFEVSLPLNVDRKDEKAEFKISVWTYGNHSEAMININGVAQAFNGEEVRAGDWILKNHYVQLDKNPKTIYLTTLSNYIYFDDFRLHPVASSMTSYVYNEWKELSYVLGADNLAAHYIYDEAGRLKEMQTEVVDYNGPGSGGFKKVSEHEYHYKNQ